jgi:hypothetical protein
MYQARGGGAKPNVPFYVRSTWRVYGSAVPLAGPPEVPDRVSRGKIPVGPAGIPLTKVPPDIFKIRGATQLVEWEGKSAAFFTFDTPARYKRHVTTYLLTHRLEVGRMFGSGRMRGFMDV